MDNKIEGPPIPREFFEALAARDEDDEAYSRDDDDYGRPVPQAVYARARSERDEAVALLRELEWIHDDEYGLPFCHGCSNGKANGHRADCRLGAFLEKVGR